MEYSVLSGSVDLTISTITEDSRKVVADSVFVCTSGDRQDGHDYVNEAIANGAVAIVVNRQIYVSDSITVILVSNTKAAFSYMAAAYYNYPAEQIKTIGVTGSRGKTTTCHMIGAILKEAGYEAGYIAEIGRPLEFQKRLNEQVQAKKDVVVVEVSSMSAKRFAYAGMTFDIGVLINLMRSHIGINEHSSYEEYIDCKGQLFRQCKLGIVNAECSKLQEILKNHSCRIETFGLRRGARLYAQYPGLIQKRGFLGNQFYVEGVLCSCFEMWIPGLFNIYNALAAIMVARELGIKEASMKKALSEVIIPGKFESIASESGATVLCDAAGNVEELQNALMTVREYVPRNVICILYPDEAMERNKRYAVGKTLAQLADEIVLVCEQGAEEVVDGISLGITEYNGCLKVAKSSEEALVLAMKEAEKKGIIVVAGTNKEVDDEVTKVTIK